MFCDYSVGSVNPQRCLYLRLRLAIGIRKKSFTDVINLKI